MATCRSLWSHQKRFLEKNERVVPTGVNDSMALGLKRIIYCSENKNDIAYEAKFGQATVTRLILGERLVNLLANLLPMVKRPNAPL